MQRQQFQLNLHGALSVTRHGRHAQLVHQARCDVGSHTHIALTTTQHQRHGGAVVAGINRKVCRRFLDQPLRTLNIARGFFDTDDTGHLAQAHHGRVKHVCHAAAGHVVENHGQVDSFGNRLEVLVLAFLRWLVVVRNHLQLAVSAYFFGKFGQLNGLSR